MDQYNANGVSYRKTAAVLGMIVFAIVSYWMGNINGRLRDTEIITAKLDERTQAIANKLDQIYKVIIVKNGYSRIIE